MYVDREQEFIERISGLSEEDLMKLAIDLYREAREDSLTGYPNGRALREDLERGGLGCIYFADIVGLKNANDNYSYDVGDALIIYCLRVLRKALSDFDGNSRVYREHGDELIGATTNLRENGKISKRIQRYFEITNLVRGLKLEDWEEISSEEREIEYWVREQLNELEVCEEQVRIPDNLSVMMSVGYSCSENPYEALDIARSEAKRQKGGFYKRHPDLDPRGRTIN